MVASLCWPQKCYEECQSTLYNLRQLQVALGKDSSRVERLFIAHPDCPSALCEVFLTENYPDLLRVKLKPLDFDKWRDATETIAFTAAISPFACLALRKNIFKKLNLADLSEHDTFINNTPSGCHGTTIITTIVLSIVWVAVARNYKKNKNSYIEESHLFSVFVNGAMTGKFLDFKKAQKAIKKSLDVIRRVSFDNLSLDEVKSIYENFEEVVNEFNFLEAVIEIDNDT